MKIKQVIPSRPEDLLFPDKISAQIILESLLKSPMIERSERPPRVMSTFSFDNSAQVESLKYCFWFIVSLVLFNQSTSSLIHAYDSDHST